MKQQPPQKLVESAPEGTVWFGGTVDESSLSLRIFGEDLIPEEISTLLGHQPTKSRIKGEKWVSKSGREVTERRGSWFLSAPDVEPGDLDFQINWILSRLTNDLETWRVIISKFKADLFSGLFLEAQNRGLTISPEALKMVGDRGIKLGFDIYFNKEN